MMFRLATAAAAFVVSCAASAAPIFPALGTPGLPDLTVSGVVEQYGTPDGSGTGAYSVAAPIGTFTTPPGATLNDGMSNTNFGGNTFSLAADIASLTPQGSPFPVNPASLHGGSNTLSVTVGGTMGGAGTLDILLGALGWAETGGHAVELFGSVTSSTGSLDAFAESSAVAVIITNGSGPVGTNIWTDAFGPISMSMVDIRSVTTAVPAPAMVLLIALAGLGLGVRGRARAA